MSQHQENKEVAPVEVNTIDQEASQEISATDLEAVNGGTEYEVTIKVKT